VEILCSDGLNYIVQVKEYNEKKDVGHLHFLKWSPKYDYRGSLTKLYLAEEGTYSEGITSMNNYAFLAAGFGAGGEPLLGADGVGADEMGLQIGSSSSSSSAGGTKPSPKQVSIFIISFIKSI
jgi:hypothetical protein